MQFRSTSYKKLRAIQVGLSIHRYGASKYIRGCQRRFRGAQECPCTQRHPGRCTYSYKYPGKSWPNWAVLAWTVPSSKEPCWVKPRKQRLDKRGRGMQEPTAIAGAGPACTMLRLSSVEMGQAGLSLAMQDKNKASCSGSLEPGKIPPFRYKTFVMGKCFEPKSLTM